MQDNHLKYERHHVHWRRKLWHAGGISTMVVIYNLIGTRPSLILLLLTSLVIIPLDFLRQVRPKLNRATLKVFGQVMRRKEYHSVSGFTFLLVGALILLLFFNHHIVNLALLFLAFGDPIASYVGIEYGTEKIVGNKTLQGALAALAVCTVIASLYYYFNNIMLERIFIVAPLSGLLAAGAELLPIGKLDDNLTFPVTSAIGLFVLFELFGGFTL
jgi:diacylglycerol kinase (CTP)